MKRIFIASAIILLATSIQAQTISAGKKFLVIASVKTNTSVSQMGTEMEIPATGTVTTDFEVKSVAGKTVTFAATLKRITGSVTMMGNEQTFDSSDSATAANPQVADALKEINKPQEIIAEAGKISLPQDASGTPRSEDVAHYLMIPVNAASVKEGYAWSDSSSTAEGSRSLNNYTVTKVSKDEVVITVISNNKTITTRQQMGMEMKVNMQGASTSIFTYDAASGILKTVATSFSTSGNNEVMGNEIPMSTKGTASVTIK